MVMRTTKGAKAGSGAAPGSQPRAVTLGLWLVTVSCAALALLSHLVLSDFNERIVRRAQAAAAAQAPSRQLARAAGAAVAGDSGAFDRLRGERERLQQGVGGLAATAPVAEPVAVTQEAWRAYREGADLILAAQEAILGVRTALAAIAPVLTGLEASMASAAELIAAEGAPAEQVLEAGWQLARIETMKAGLGSLPGAGDAPQPALAMALGAFGTSLQTLIEQAGTRAESAAGPVLMEIAARFDTLRTAAAPLPGLVSRAQPARATLISMQAAGDQFAGALDRLVAAAWEAPRVTRLGPLPVVSWSAPVFGGVALSGGLLLALGAARRREAAARREGGLAGPGVAALRNASGSPPAALAEAADEALERVLERAPDLPGGGSRTAGSAAFGAPSAGSAAVAVTLARLAAASAHSRTAALHLREAAALQAGQIALVGGGIQSLAEDLGALLTQAGESAAVAARAVAVAARGTQAVCETRGGVAVGQVLDLSERVGRCDASSQALGAHLEVLADNLDQITLVALNAVIQAAVAGEGGAAGGLAEGVARLAGEAAENVRQIEVLLFTLQAQTRAAVLAIEEVAVVPGADAQPQVADALREWEAACAAGADHSVAVADAVRQQARQAAALRETVAALRAAAAEHAQETRGAAQSFDDLLSLAAELHHLVPGAPVP